MSANHRLSSLRASIFFSLLAASSLLLQGCLGVKSYVDPGLAKVAAADLHATADPQPLSVSFEFQTNGEHNKRATKIVLPKIIRTIEMTGLFTSPIIEKGAATGDGFRLNLVLNNVADVGAAFGKGFGTGLTFGAAGSLVTDGYVFTTIFEKDGRETFKREYRHAIHTTVGNKKGPEGLEPMSTQDAVDRVVEQLVLNLLKELQSDGQL